MISNKFHRGLTHFIYKNFITKLAIFFYFKSYQDHNPDPVPFLHETDPRIQIRITMKRIQNADYSSNQNHISGRNRMQEHDSSSTRSQVHKDFRQWRIKFFGMSWWGGAAGGVGLAKEGLTYPSIPLPKHQKNGGAKIVELAKM